MQIDVNLVFVELVAHICCSDRILNTLLLAAKAGSFPSWKMKRAWIGPIELEFPKLADPIIRNPWSSRKFPVILELKIISQHGRPAAPFPEVNDIFGLLAADADIVTRKSANTESLLNFHQVWKSSRLNSSCRLTHFFQHLVTDIRLV